MVDDYVDNPVYSKARAQIDKAKEAHNRRFNDSKITLVWGAPAWLKEQDPVYASTSQMGGMSWKNFDELDVQLVPLNGTLPYKPKPPVLMMIKAKYAAPMQLHLFAREVFNVIAGVQHGCSLGMARSPDNKIIVDSVQATVYADNITGEVFANVLKTLEASYSAVESQILTGMPEIDWWEFPGPWMQ